MNPPGVAPHLLVIDDDPAIVRVYIELFEEEGYRITSWPFPERDSAAIRAIGPDAVLVDLYFSESAAGWEFVEYLRGQPETADLPVVVASASSRLGGAERDQLTEWACRIVIKPFDIEEIITAVEDAVARVPIEE
jgi:CheY-like chemotaxis protein